MDRIRPSEGCDMGSTPVESATSNVAVAPSETWLVSFDGI